VSESQRAVQTANRGLAQANREHEEYKKRAAGILQAKEKVIASLQEGGVGVSGSAHKASLEQLRLEKEAVQAELETARLQGEGLRTELQEAEEQHSHEMTQLSEQVQELEKGLESEKALQRSATEDLQRVVSELEVSREQWERERGSLAALVKEKEAEVEQLKTKVQYGV
jgi:chromosome segregation ATPase